MHDIRDVRHYTEKITATIPLVKKGDKMCHRIQSHLTGPKHGIQTPLARGPVNRCLKPQSSQKLVINGEKGYKVAIWS